MPTIAPPIRAIDYYAAEAMNALIQSDEFKAAITHFESESGQDRFRILAAIAYRIGAEMVAESALH